ncbi:dethiobiotin synthase [Amphibiibacter pelophylacis]|uniref:Dethiobiotin synthase n=1 Tax=Amphibiibacter pelophylacis TaxID=1799477 RepID=A0ACC6P2K6_9BURK
MPESTIFITGTDTEVGKTWVSAALLQLLGRHGAALGCKPVSAGQTHPQPGEAPFAPFNEDVRWLQACSVPAVGDAPLLDAQVGPIQLDEPCAPHIAAARQGLSWDQDAAPLRSTVLGAVEALAARSRWLVVEGVGGWAVPLAQGWDSAALARDVCPPGSTGGVVLVVGLRLGCLNHALLTAQAVAASGLRLLGWVAKSGPQPMAHEAENLATLDALLPAPRLGHIPWLGDADVGHALRYDAAALRALAMRAASHLDQARLLRALGS